MTTVPTILVLLAAVTAMAIAARRARLPYPSVMVIGGLLIAWVPGLPHLALNPDVFFTLFLPPLLYAAAWQTSWRDFKANLRPILLLAIGFVLFTTFIVAALAHALIPQLPWAAAFALGAIVSPPDAIAATAIAQTLGLPRRIITILEGESLVNDASALTLYRVAVAAAVTGVFSWKSAILTGTLAVVLGIGMGLLLGWLIMRLHKLMDDPLQETIITLLSPFAAFIAAEHMHGSGVLAVVAMGLFVSRHSHEIFQANTRLHAASVWETADFVFNGLVFVLIGLQLPIIVKHIEQTDTPLHTLAIWAIGLCIVVIVVRMAWVFPASYVPRLLSKTLRERDPMPGWKAVFVIAFIGMRGATSLAAALALPLVIDNGQDFPRRDLIIFFTFSVIIATLVLQSLLLPPIIRALKLQNDRTGEGEEWQARLLASEAALERVKHLESTGPRDESAVRKRTLLGLRKRYEARITRYSSVPVDPNQTPENTVDDTVYRDVLGVERAAIVKLRDDDVISDEVLRRIFGELDLDESRIIQLTR